MDMLRRVWRGVMSRLRGWKRGALLTVVAALVLVLYGTLARESGLSLAQMPVVSWLLTGNMITDPGT